ncbi:hypothetical protein [Rubellicoccus peritrichatus]|uniref:Uncharacterized protein n=1 Tax=Rubellicoccus peritrichatus TaxID=3080537 RepID=A0AAQ3QYD8_9BACT|nr:hypothetical protein [Puniceicoccus sp. CR14]WOO43695.1 hypothetical protein RZN69_11405 [Puniceicoccus sp. CR14]
MLTTILVEVGISTDKTELEREQAHYSSQAEVTPKTDDTFLALEDYRRAISESNRLRTENEALKTEIARFQASGVSMVEISSTPHEQGKKYAEYVAATAELARTMDERKDLAGFGELFNDEEILSLYDSLIINHGIEQLRGKMLFSWEFSPSERADWAVAALSENSTIDESKIRSVKNILNDAYAKTAPFLMSEGEREKVSNQVKDELAEFLTESELEYYRTLFGSDSWIPRPQSLFH